MREPSTSTTDQPRCAGVTRTGQPCQIRVLVNGQHCFAHAPELEPTRTEARRKGGRNRATVARSAALMPARLIPLYAELERTLAGVLDGTIDPKIAHAAAAVCRVMVAVVSAGELEARLRDLEAGGRRGTA